MRTYKRKTDRGTKSIDVYFAAANLVADKKKSLRQAAKEFELSYESLRRFIKKQKEGDTSFGYATPRQVFNQNEEKQLSEYLINSANIYFGLAPNEVRKLAYDCALKFKVSKIPDSWHKEGKAGADWFAAFMNRNKELAIRAPEATSLSRATSFNKHNVSSFFSKLGEVMLKHNLPPSRIWNLDEVGLTTVQKPRKIVAQKGVKQVGALTSAERGELVTVENAISAAGCSIPPMFVFPRMRYTNLFVREGPPESIGAGNRSGWMTASEFIVYIDHFIKFTKPTPDEPVLLLLDNHCSHIDIKVIDKARANGIIMLSFPPHCTHRLQPLDVGVYGPFKKYCATAQDNWMSKNPGKTMKIHDLPGIVKYAWPLASTPKNIMHAFEKCGIHPFNANIFSDTDFAPSFVTDRELPVSIPTANVSNSNQEATQQLSNPGTSANVTNEKRISQLSNPDHAQNFTPHSVRPFPKAPPRKNKSTKRKVRKSAVLTDSPERHALAAEQESRTVTKEAKKKANKPQKKS